MNTLSLHQYQKDGIAWLTHVRRGLLGDEPGLGKSRQMIEASQGPTLVIAPAMVIAGGTWEDEITRWADDPERFTVVTFTRLNPRVRTQGSGNRPVAGVREEYLGPWATLIVDEAHYIKGRQTSWTKAVQLLSKTADRVYLATGTPIANWAHELYTILQILRPQDARRGEDLGSYWRWVARWFEVYPSRFGSQGARDIGDLLRCRAACLDRPAWDPCEHYREFADENLGGQFLRRLRDDCLDLPPVTQQDVRTPMDAATKRVYRRLRDEFILEMGDGSQSVSWSVGARNVQLDLCTVSPWLLDPEGSPKGGKFEYLREDLRSRARPTLVLAHYRQVVEGCAEVARSVGARVGVVHGGVSKSAATQAIRAFQGGRLDVLVGSLETVAEGLTLTAADMAVFVERSFKPYRNVQAMRRIHRLGQERPVTIRRYLTPQSVDSHKEQLLDTKTDRQMRVLSARDFATLL